LVSLKTKGKNKMSNKVSIIRMLSGTEIIGEIVSDGTDQVKLKNPLVIQFGQGEKQGEIAVAMGPIAPFAKRKAGEPDSFALNSYLIEFDYEVEDSIADQYRSYISKRDNPSNLILPAGAGKIVGPNGK